MEGECEKMAFFDKYFISRAVQGSTKFTVENESELVRHLTNGAIPMTLSDP